MTHTETSDIETELGRPPASTAETAQWQAWIDRVERAITRAFTKAGFDLDDQIAVGDPDAEDVRDVVVAAVVEKIKNPDGLTSITKSIDDGAVTKRREGSDSGDPLNLDEKTIDDLLPERAAAAFSIGLMSGRRRRR